MPTGSAPMRYKPSASVVSVRVKPVVGLFAVTVTPGIAAPCWSTTRPVIAPVVCCAYAAAHVSSRAITARRSVLIIHSSRKSAGNVQCPASDRGRWRPLAGLEHISLPFRYTGVNPHFRWMSQCEVALSRAKVAAEEDWLLQRADETLDFGALRRGGGQPCQQIAGGGGGFGATAGPGVREREVEARLVQIGIACQR